MERKNVWTKYTDKQVKDLNKFADSYIDFLSSCKTERECVERIIADCEKEGYLDLNAVIKEGKTLKAGDRVYAVNRGKGIILFELGKEPLEKGMNILGAHVDSPRLDIKQNPLYESDGFAYLDTHYYGGIKKYQWVTIPLALHGVVAKKDGTKVEIKIGEDEKDPVFFVSDLLIHLAEKQMQKKGAVVIEGEELDVIIGNRPGKETDDEKKDLVKNRILDILKENYGIEEEDFLSAEIEAVPAGRAREAGFDRSMVLSYGQDDRVCAFSSYKAMFEVKNLKKTACCILVDKEEIGSVGATGMQSRFFENTVAELMSAAGDYNELKLRRCLSSSKMLSSDVSSAFDPTFANSFDKKNVAYFGRGLVLNKFTGARGKSGSNDADAEYIAELRKIFAKEKVDFQTAELGRVDLGGGGTIAYITALYGMQVIDCGVPVLNMHAPHEATSKADLFEVKRGYVAFLKNA
ncbi:MAG: aminopeptidase [Firmicutes bacterium]|nr:aminopeptidase [Bacillota bacterium]